MRWNVLLISSSRWKRWIATHRLTPMHGKPCQRAWLVLSSSWLWSLMRDGRSCEQQKLASICCLALRELDEQLYARISLLLSSESPISDHLVQEAALKATTVLIRRLLLFVIFWVYFADFWTSVPSFPMIAANMASHLRRFVTSPLPIFEFEFASERRAPPPLSAAAKCLALCIKVK